MKLAWWCIFPAVERRVRFIRAEAPCWKGEIQIWRIVLAWEVQRSET